MGIPFKVKFQVKSGMALEWQGYCSDSQILIVHNPGNSDSQAIPQDCVVSVTYCWSANTPQTQWHTMSIYSHTQSYVDLTQACSMCIHSEA